VFGSRPDRHSSLEGSRRGIKFCTDIGYDDEQVRKMVSINTARSTSRLQRERKASKTKCSFHTRLSGNGQQRGETQ
jgi:hypothetical protein